MTKSAKAAKLPPIVPSRRGSSGVTEEPGFRGWGVFSFPPSNRLVVTTTKGVYIWDVYGISEIFRSSSQGIVAAKMIVNDSEMLAVADSQVVVLHDISGGMRRSYRLKGSGVSAAPFYESLIIQLTPSRARSGYWSMPKSRRTSSSQLHFRTPSRHTL